MNINGIQSVIMLKNWANLDWIRWGKLRVEEKFNELNAQLDILTRLFGVLKQSAKNSFVDDVIDRTVDFPQY